MENKLNVVHTISYGVDDIYSVGNIIIYCGRHVVHTIYFVTHGISPQHIVFRGNIKVYSVGSYAVDI